AARDAERRRKLAVLQQRAVGGWAHARAVAGREGSDGPRHRRPGLAGEPYRELRQLPPAGSRLARVGAEGVCGDYLRTCTDVIRVHCTQRGNPRLGNQRRGGEEGAARVDASPAELSSRGAVDEDHRWSTPRPSDTRRPMPMLNVGDPAPDFTLT